MAYSSWHLMVLSPRGGRSLRWLIVADSSRRNRVTSGADRGAAPASRMTVALQDPFDRVQPENIA